METIFGKIEVVRSLRTSDKSKGIKVGEYYLDKFEIGTSIFFASLLQWTDKGWANNYNTFYYVVGENCDTWEQGINLFLDKIIETINTIQSPYLIDIIDLTDQENILNKD